MLGHRLGIAADIGTGVDRNEELSGRQIESGNRRVTLHQFNAKNLVRRVDASIVPVQENAKFVIGRLIPLNLLVNRSATR